MEKVMRIGEFPREVVRKLVDAANYVLDNVVFTAWTEDEMRAKWRRRSLDGILSDREVNHIFPCVDTAALAVKHLQESGREVYLTLMTEKGAVDAFREGRARALHIDAMAEVEHKGQSYGIDIGAGDIQLLKKIPNPEKRDAELFGEETYLTTRPEKHEKIWHRTPFLRISGRTLIANSATPVLGFAGTEDNLVAVPYLIRGEEFFMFPAAEDEPSFLVTNLNYDAEACAKWNKEWTSHNQKQLPSLKPFRYV